MLFSRQAYHAIRIVLGLIFIVSGGIKLFGLGDFAATINAFAIIPEEFSLITAVAITFLELLLGMGLVFDIKGGLSGIFVLLTGFVLVLGWALYMGYDVDCGCFGPTDPEAKAFSSIRTSLWRDIFMIGMVIYLYIWRYKNEHVPKHPLQFFNNKNG
jgi:uncharacterized membrane protein YphA (DoxX/SURF4 family)